MLRYRQNEATASTGEKTLNTRNTNSKRLQTAATRLVATALVMIVGVAATHSAYAIEQVSDATLNTEIGSVPKFYSGDCTGTGANFCGFTAVRCAARAREDGTTTPYDITLTDYALCSGGTATSTTATCLRGSGPVGARQVEVATQIDWQNAFCAVAQGSVPLCFQDNCL